MQFLAECSLHNDKYDLLHKYFADVASAIGHLRTLGAEGRRLAALAAEHPGPESDRALEALAEVEEALRKSADDLSEVRAED